MNSKSRRAERMTAGRVREDELVAMHAAGYVLDGYARRNDTGVFRAEPKGTGKIRRFVSK